jgi:Cu-Zn family superoxide dismutase
VEVTDGPDATSVVVDVHDLEPGFHGFHVHAIGVCEPDSTSPTDPSVTGDFMSAGGHLATGSQVHGSHTGDLPSLYVLPDGTGMLTAMTESFSSEDLLDEDGSAFMVHVGPDNFANIPTRYAPDGPDETTLATGDSGDRLACGVAE